jgi:hypothetical protein
MLNALENTKDKKLPFSMPDFFEGICQAFGIFETRSGETKRRFSATVEGYWQNDIFYLDEEFVFSDGAHEHRTWKLKFNSDGTFSADCVDVPSPASGYYGDDTAHLSYKFKLRHKGKSYNVKFADTFAKLADDLVINRTIMTKWGITLGHVTIVFRKQI